MPVIEAEFTREGGKAAAQRILTEHPGVTAVLALNDDMAIGVLSVLRSRGISVPEPMVRTRSLADSFNAFGVRARTAFESACCPLR